MPYDMDTLYIYSFNKRLIQLGLQWLLRKYIRRIDGTQIYSYSIMFWNRTHLVNKVTTFTRRDNLKVLFKRGKKL